MNLPKKLLVTNRGEIAIRIFRACSEMGIRTVAVYSHEDRLALHRYKADEAYPLNSDQSPVGAYLNHEELIKICKENDIDAVHPGYGFLSENSEFAKKVIDAGMIWVGPQPETMELLGDKIAARAEAQAANIPVVPGSPGELETLEDVKKTVDVIGFPCLIKAAGGGGGRGMAVVRQENELSEKWEKCRRESEKAFGNPAVFVERFIENPRHVEVQILGDKEGQVVHFYERDCSVQRRFQKVVEVAPSANLSEETRQGLLTSSLALARHVGYTNAGTMEFLVESQGPHAGQFYFIEANARLQVEHTVTEWVTGVDLVQSQIRLASGETLKDLELDKQENITCRGFAIQCRINAEDASHDFAPQVGRITTWRSAAGMGVRLDSGGGDVNFEVSPHYDSLLCKVSTWGPTLKKAAGKMDRALKEFRIRGVRTNIPFLQNVIEHSSFQEGTTTTSFIEEHPELFKFPPRLNRANKLLYYLADQTLHRASPIQGAAQPVVPEVQINDSPGSREDFLKLGRTEYLKKIRNDDKLHLTDTTLRDAHQSLFATRMRTKDMLPILPVLNHLPLWSLEVWGGATYDVAYRFLKECPWERLEKIREECPKVLLQMLLRGSNVVGYRNQPDNLIKRFIREAQTTGIDVFRIFDALNYLPNLQVAIEAVREQSALAEVAVCYTGDVADSGRTRYSLNYYVDLAGKMFEMGADIIAIKDMAGLLTPRAAALLIPAIRKEVPCPIHLHTHDTTSFGGAMYLEAANQGVDIIDAAMGPMSGLTSQPNLGTLVANLRGTPRDTQVDSSLLRGVDWYWQTVRESYAEFESGLKSGTASVYWHEIPGGQYSNLLPQAKALKLEDRWGEVLDKFHQANEVMGDPIKVTPTSKAVGDLALYMVSQNLDKETVFEKASEINWPLSVRDYFKGLMGQHPYGFDKKMQKAVLGGESFYEDRAGNHLDPIDFEKDDEELNELLGREAVERERLTHFLFPQVFHDFAKHQHRFGDTSVLDTDLFFHGLEMDREFQVELEKGKTLMVMLKAIGEPNDKGERTFHFEVNGFPRAVQVRDRNLSEGIKENKKARKNRNNEIGSPMPGKISKLLVKEGEAVEKGATVFVIEAMKMETLVACQESGTVDEIFFAENDTVSQDDLVITLAK